MSTKELQGAQPEQALTIDSLPSELRNVDSITDLLSRAEIVVSEDNLKGESGNGYNDFETKFTIAHGEQGPIKASVQEMRSLVNSLQQPVDNPLNLVGSRSESTPQFNPVPENLKDVTVLRSFIKAVEEKVDSGVFNSDVAVPLKFTNQNEAIAKASLNQLKDWERQLQHSESGTEIPAITKLDPKTESKAKQIINEAKVTELMDAIRTGEYKGQLVSANSEINIDGVSLPISQWVDLGLQNRHVEEQKSLTNQEIEKIENNVLRLDGVPEQVKKEFLKRGAKAFYEAELLGKKPDTKYLPIGVDYQTMKKYYEPHMPQSMSDKMKAMQLAQERYYLANREEGGDEDGRFAGGSLPARDLESYFFRAVLRERMEFYRGLDQPERMEFIARTALELMRGGRAGNILNMVAEQLKADYGAASIESNVFDGMTMPGRLAGTTGYKDPDEYYKMLDYLFPEQVHTLLDQDLHSKFWINEKRKNDKGIIEEKLREEVELEYGAHDLYATFLSFEALPEILTSRVMDYDPKNPLGLYLDDPNSGRDEVKGYYTQRFKWYGYSVLRKLGYDEQESMEMVMNFQKGNGWKTNDGNLEIDVLRTDLISMIEGSDINKLEEWMGVMWGNMMYARSMIALDQMNYAICPSDDFQGIAIPGLRKSVNTSDYYRNYNLYLPGMRNMDGKILLPNPDALNYKDVLLSPLLGAIEAGGSSEDTAVQRRKEDITKIVEWEIVAPEEARHMGQAVLAKGEYEPPSHLSPNQKIEWFRKNFNGFMEGTDKFGNTVSRHFDSWNQAYEELIVKDQSFKDAWKGFDFKPLLKKCGLVEEDFERFKAKNGNDALIGEKGFELFTKHANHNLVDHTGTRHQKQDTTYRYSEHRGKWLSDYFKWMDLSAFIPPETMAGKSKELRRKIAGDLYSKYLESIPEAAGNISTKKFGGPAEKDHSLVSAIRNMTEARAAWSLDSYVQHVGYEDPEGGMQLREKQITIQDFEDRWKEILGSSATQSQLDEVKRIIEAHNFWFIGAPEKRQKSGKKKADKLYGPHWAYIPQVSKARDVYDELISDVELALNGGIDKKGKKVKPIRKNRRKNEILLQRLKHLKATGFYSHDSVIKGGCSLSAYEIKEHIENINTETADIKQSSVKELLEEINKLQESGQISDAVIFPEQITKKVGWNMRAQTREINGIEKWRENTTSLPIHEKAEVWEQGGGKSWRKHRRKPSFGKVVKNAIFG